MGKRFFLKIHKKSSFRRTKRFLDRRFFDLKFKTFFIHGKVPFKLGVQSRGSVVNVTTWALWDGK
jgi:hypothetical protein